MMTPGITWKKCGAHPVETQQAARVPDPMPQKGPPQTTGGHPLCSVESRHRRMDLTLLAKNQEL